ncbi:MAG: hypothetical protein LBG80_07240 [Bacteroidales bacterium]|jgi:hypothetical protein|nr:hypothetical protein [Bacteroidales bacterium]
MVWINIIIVFLFGALFGFAEILQRYANTKYNFKVWMSYVYIALNGIVAVLALFLIKYFKNPDDVLNFKTIEAVNLLIAGFGGMMVLRSSIFSIKHKDDTIEVGLATLFQVFLSRVERRMKNKAAAYRFTRIAEIMKDVDFELAKQSLFSICTAFIDNFPDEEIISLTNKIEEISNSDIENRDKSILLGRFIASFCDEEILDAVIKELLHTEDDTDFKDNNDIDNLIKQLNK